MEGSHPEQLPIPAALVARRLTPSFAQTSARPAATAVASLTGLGANELYRALTAG